MAPTTSQRKQAEILAEVGMGATLHYPQDTYGFVVVRVSPSGKTAYVKPLKTVDKTTGHEPAYFNGPFPVWSHEYTDDEKKSMLNDDAPERIVRRTSRGWTSKGTPFSLGTARFHRDYSY